MDNPKDLKSIDCGLIERHPGWWFKDIFSGLNKLEKVAWLELLTLAVASYPYGSVTFCSVKQLATLLDIDEASLALVIKKAGDRWMIEVKEAVVIPVSGEPTEIRRVYSQDLPIEARRLMEEADVKVARFYVMVFPGFYFDRRGPYEERISATWERLTGYSQLEEYELDLQLEEPLELLKARLATGEQNNCRTQVEESRPFGSRSTIELPWEPLYHVGSADEVDKFLERAFAGLLPIPNKDPRKTVIQIWAARFQMKEMFSSYLMKVPGDKIVRH